MGTFAKPEQRQQKASKTPRRQNGKQEEVCHHRPKRQENDIVRQEVEGETGHQDWRPHGQDIQGLLLGDDLVDPCAVNPKDGINHVDADEGDVEERPQVLRVDVPSPPPC